MDDQRPDSPRPHPRIRCDGWTPERQLGFLDALQRTRSVTEAAHAVGMARKSAYRLRLRREGALFALLWDKALTPADRHLCESHNGVLTDGRLARTLGYHFLRKTADAKSLGSAQAQRGGLDPTGTS